MQEMNQRLHQHQCAPVLMMFNCLNLIAYLRYSPSSKYLFPLQGGIPSGHTLRIFCSPNNLSLTDFSIN